MLKEKSVTIINNDHIRGVLAPSGVISKKLLEDMVDFLELSSPELMRETEELESEADAEQSWLSLEEMRKRSEMSA
ncbi:hypothetical protein CL632_03670 [bacterium]|jgi:hypothetical protein|nr:hypothetical protein [bacterium]MDP6571461.1 hypothetical protein [Patescibacteria group bacterium]MDP6756203.1 hypothetical protein [Patescibacteria group bacterium]|tara:strand:+ start:171 stop:398 length:228 start_codon:yes stop_codon:yes gene_type:complete